jgi:hypothetical protein
MYLKRGPPIAENKSTTHRTHNRHRTGSTNARQGKLRGHGRCHVCISNTLQEQSKVTVTVTGAATATVTVTVTRQKSRLPLAYIHGIISPRCRSLSDRGPGHPPGILSRSRSRTIYFSIFSLSLCAVGCHALSCFSSVFCCPMWPLWNFFSVHPLVGERPGDFSGFSDQGGLPENSWVER